MKFRHWPGETVKYSAGAPPGMNAAELFGVTTALLPIVHHTGKFD